MRVLICAIAACLLCDDLTSIQSSAAKTEILLLQLSILDHGGLKESAVCERRVLYVFLGMFWNTPIFKFREICRFSGQTRLFFYEPPVFESFDDCQYPLLLSIARARNNLLHTDKTNSLHTNMGSSLGCITHTRDKNTRSYL